MTNRTQSKPQINPKQEQLQTKTKDKAKSIKVNTMK